MAVLYRDDNLHSDEITSRIIDSALTVLGSKGDTPERTVRTLLGNRKKYFRDGSYKSYFRLDRG
jgi:hypothetical protein